MKEKGAIMTDHNDALSLHKYSFIGFSPDHDREDARRIFQERMGYLPDVMLINSNILWVGPVLEERETEQLRLC